MALILIMRAGGKMAGHVKLSWLEPGDVRTRSTFGVPQGHEGELFIIRLDDGRLLKVKSDYIVKIEDCEAGYHG